MGSIVDVEQQLTAGIYALTADGQIEITIAVVVAPNDFAVVEAEQIDLNRIKTAVAVVGKYARVGLLATVGHIIALTADDQVDIAVVIVVAPIDAALRHAGKLANKRKAATFKGIQEGAAIAKGVFARQGHIEIAVAIVVAPGHIAGANGRKTCLRVDHQRTALVAIEEGLRLAAAILSADGQV